MDTVKGLFSGLSSRRNSKVSINLDDEQQYEDYTICKVDSLNINTTSWHDPSMFSVLHINEDFNHFLEQTMLGGFANCPQEIYMLR
jgi:hypothetical protein